MGSHESVTLPIRTFQPIKIPFVGPRLTRPPQLFGIYAQNDTSVTRVRFTVWRTFGGRVKLLRLVTCTFMAPSQGSEWHGNHSGDIVRQGRTSRREKTDLLSQWMVRLRARHRPGVTGEDATR